MADETNPPAGDTGKPNIKWNVILRNVLTLAFIAGLIFLLY